jgi:hypothetical protein
LQGSTAADAESPDIPWRVVATILLKKVVIGVEMARTGSNLAAVEVSERVHGGGGDTRGAGRCRPAPRAHCLAAPTDLGEAQVLDVRLGLARAPL